jgi:choline-sulfatase
LPPLESDPHPIVRIVRRARECDRAFSEDERRFLRRRYAAMIAEADAMLGRTMQAMDELGLWENTYFVFVSDHGEMDLEHNLVFKSMHHEPSSRVAMMVAGPGVDGPQRVERCTSLVDVCPSLLALAEVSPEGPLDGRSLMPALIGDEASLADEAFSEYHANGLPTGSFMLRRGPWKYHAYIGYPGELFHLPSDPGELTNLIDAQPQQAAEMDRALRRIVDPEAIDAKAKRHDRESFARWRHGLDEAAYQQAMTELYGTWDDQRQAQIDAWLNEDA